ncbi:flagellar filament capping protein FliD [uncultured Shewanella sp.]|uniref:flagellar filament capping protein FliD n=1 Tax=uncultured Shewanella sp. TaxID=173975 RepID=UPI00261A8A7B|nr:flagellar filament capping protein FliD [uncultured Shewanella sp.]
MISGIDSASFAQQLVAAERMGKDQLYSTKLSTSNAQLDAYKLLETHLDKISSKLGKIDGESFEKKTASITDDAAKITVDPSAPKGNYTLEVIELAQAHQVSTTFGTEDELLTDAGITGSLSIQLGSDAADIVTLDLDTLNADGKMTVADLRDKINAASDNPGVTASLMRTGSSVQLLLTSNETGIENTLDVQIDKQNDGNPEAFATTQIEAKDANIKLNGVEITNSKNYLEDVIDGVSIELNQAHSINASTGERETSTIKIDSDYDSSKDSVIAFVDSFNDFIDSINNLTRSMGSTVLDETRSTSSSSSSDSDDTDDDDEEEFKTTAVSEDQIGVLKGDASLRMLQSNMRNVMFQTAPNGMRLSDIGIEINRSGKLDIDKDKLTEALKSDPDAVKAMFSDSGSYVEQLETITKPFTQTAGLLDMKESNLDAQIKRIENDMSQFDYRMNQKYQIYLAQFNAMNNTVNALSAASSLFSQNNQNS